MEISARKSSRRPFWYHTAAVFAAWVKEPSQVASICPSSTKVTRAISDRECVRSAKTIVDLGPGTGATTVALLDHAPADCRLLAIEKTDQFIEPLNSLDDPRLIVEHGDAVELDRMLVTHEMASPDVIVSGIPFSSLPPDTATGIMKAIYRSLSPGGTLIAYQLREHVAAYASVEFGEPTSQQWVVWNLPPLRITTWQKPAAVHTPGSADE